MTPAERIAEAEALLRQTLARLKAMRVRVYSVAAGGAVVWLTAPGRKFSVATEPEKR